MLSVKLVLLILAAVSFLLAALEVSAPRVNLTAAGLLLATLAFMIG